MDGRDRARETSRNQAATHAQCANFWPRRVAQRARERTLALATTTWKLRKRKDAGHDQKASFGLVDMNILRSVSTTKL